jgi:hypothetical protein
MAFSYTDSWKLAQPSQDSRLSRMSVRNGLALDKGVCQFELPIYLYHDMRQSPHAHATWKRLTPFFHLPGVVTPGRNTVEVALRPFNDKRYNQDLEALCERVNAVAPRLPDGRRLHVSVQTNALVRPIVDMQKRRVA